MSVYYRPLIQTDATRPPDAHAIAGGWCWFDRAQRLERGQTCKIVPAGQIPPDILNAITKRRAPVIGLDMARPRLMGILNVTPDSFSDGGLFEQPGHAADHALAMLRAGADIIDIGGESTRPGAAPVPEPEEIKRTWPVIKAIRARSDVPISIDTRNAGVARAALVAGASFVNDVSALGHDVELADIIAKTSVPVCLMHARGDPQTMQDNPEYDDVLLDVYDHLSERITYARSHGIAQDKIVIDPGIGFGKTPDHNLTLIRNISLFHSLGCPILLGVSRKSFIGKLAKEPDAHARGPASLALALIGIAQGVQISRVHDIAEMRQALTLWLAATGKGQG